MSILSIVLRATDQASSVIRSVEGSLNDLSRSGASMKSVGGAITGVGRAMTVGVTLPIVALGGLIAKTAIDFEDNMAKVRAISGATGEDFKKLTDKARELGRTTTYTASEVAQGMTFLAQAGWDANQVLAAMPSLLTMAQAGGIGLAESTSIAADTMTAFGISSDKASHFADVMAMTANKTNTDIAMLGESFKYIAPIAHALGISLEQSSAMLGIMANNGIKASQAGTTLRMGLTRLTKPTKQAQIMMDYYGIALKDAHSNLLPLPQVIDNLNKGFSHMTDSQQMAATKMIFGAEAMTGMLVLIKSGSGNLNELTGSFQNSNGAAKDMATIMNDTTGGSIRKMNAALSDMAITIGNTLAPTISDIAHTVADLAKSFSTLDPSVQQTIITVIAIGAALGPVLMVVGNLIKLVSGLWKVLSGLGTVIEFVAGVFGVLVIEVVAVIALIAAIVAIVIYAVKHWDEIAQSYKDMWTSIKGFFSGLWSGVVDGFNTAISWISDRIKGFKDFFVNIFNGAVDLILSPFRAIAEGINAAIDGINSIEIKVPDWVPGIGGKGWGGFSIPHIPKFHTGGVFRAAVAGGEGSAILKDGEYISAKRPSGGSSEGRIGTFTVQNNIGGKRVSSTLIDVFGKGMVSGIKLRTGVTS